MDFLYSGLSDKLGRFISRSRDSIDFAVDALVTGDSVG